jgi:hypothetical protein
MVNTNYLRTNYRITGDKIGAGSLKVAAGSSYTSGAAAVVGVLSVAHGLATTPVFVIAAPLCGDTLAACGRKVQPIGKGAVYISFLQASTVINASLDLTAVTSARTSSVAMTFVWAAFG